MIHQMTMKCFFNIGQMMTQGFVQASVGFQWLRYTGSNARGKGFIPCQGTKILYAAWHSQNFLKI